MNVYDSNRIFDIVKEITWVDVPLSSSVVVTVKESEPKKSRSDV